MPDRVLSSRHTAISYFPDTDEGNARFEFFQQVIAWHPMRKVVNQLDWAFSSGGSHFALALFTFLYVDIIDATATLYSMVRFCSVVNRQDGDFPRSTLAYCTDAAFISVGALLGSSPVTVFIESGAGIAEGGRTGLTAIFAGLCFIASVFFAPIFASIPPWATDCTLILVRASSLGRLWWRSGQKGSAGIVVARCVGSCELAGGVHDDVASHSDQLALHWRRAPVFCRHCLHPL